jgi:hypothetical protein
MGGSVRDLIEFWAARLDEDEEGAPDLHDLRACVLGANERFGECRCSAPARVLREVEADRELLDLLDRAIRYRDRVFAQPPPRSVSDEMRAVTQMLALEQVVKLRIAVYSDHPDCRQEWKP